MPKINKIMALQYLDAESIPHFVVLRSSDKTYQGSWSSAYSMKFQGDYAVLIGHNNAEMGLKIKFDEIDWEACLPIPNPIPTDTEGYMAYLSTYFTGQAIAPTPPTMSVQTIYSQPFLLDLAVDGLYCASPAGTPSIIIARERVVVPAGYTVLSMAIYAKGNNDTAVPFNIYAFDKDNNETIVLSEFLPIAADETLIFPVTTEIPLPADWRIGVEYQVPSGTGMIEVTGTAMLVKHTQ